MALCGEPFGDLLVLKRTWVDLHKIIEPPNEWRKTPKYQELIQKTMSLCAKIPRFDLSTFASSDYTDTMNTRQTGRQNEADYIRSDPMCGW